MAAREDFTARAQRKGPTGGAQIKESFYGTLKSPRLVLCRAVLLGDKPGEPCESN